MYTKEIGVGIYDLLQEQFGAEADMTTVYSYIFRICELYVPGFRTNISLRGRCSSCECRRA